MFNATVPVYVTNDITLSSGNCKGDNWHLSQLGNDGSLDEIILDKEAMLKVYLTLGTILLGQPLV